MFYSRERLQEPTEHGAPQELVFSHAALMMAIRSGKQIARLPVPSIDDEQWSRLISPTEVPSLESDPDYLVAAA